MGDIRKTIKKESNNQQRAPPPPPPSEEASNIHINVNVDEDMIKKINADQKKEALNILPDMFRSIEDLTHEKAIKDSQAAMGDRLFADRIFVAEQVKATEGTAPGTMVLRFDQGETVIVDFMMTPSAADMRFDQAIGIDTRFAQYMTPYDRVQWNLFFLTVWNRRRVIRDCKVGPHSGRSSACLLEVTFTDGTVPMEQVFLSASYEVFETYADAAKAAYAWWSKILEWKEHAAQEPVKPIVFAVFRKRNTVFLSTCNTRCVFQFSYYGARVETLQQRE